MQSHGVGLSVHDLGRSFGPQTILKNFSLEVTAGEFISVLGPSGSGKSTLLRLIAGLDEPNIGEVKLADTRAAKSFVFQDPTLLPWRNLKQNLELVFELTQEPIRTSRISEVLELVGLENDALKYPNQLSGGMRMRASVARALITRPRLLLLDEPFSALDENTRYRLQEELYSIWQKQKMTVIFVTHSISEAVFLSQRAIVLGKAPAQIVLNHSIALPELRISELRTDSRYIGEIKVLSKAFA